eukprot:Rmarinus@m.17856
MSSGSKSRAIKLGLWDESYQGISTEEAKSMVVEATIYVLFLFVFTLAIFFSRDSEMAFVMRDRLKSLYVGRDFLVDGGIKNYDEITTVEDYYHWVRSVFIPATFEESFPDTYNTPLRDSYIYGVSRILGLIRWRQSRMGKESCHIHSGWADQFNDVCVQALDAASVNKDSYGGPNNDAYTWWSSDEAGGVAFYGLLGYIPMSGFVVDVAGTNETYAAEVVLSMEENEYVDLMTRAILIDFGVYNAQANLYGDIRFLFEFPPSGGVMPSYRLRILNLHRYDGSLGLAILTLELLTYLFVVYYSVIEVGEFREAWHRAEDLKSHVRRLGFRPRFFERVPKPAIREALAAKLRSGQIEEYRDTVAALTDDVNLKACTSVLPTVLKFYWKDWGSILDSLNLALFYASGALRILTVVEVETRDFYRGRDHYVDIQVASEYLQMEAWVNATNAFLSWFKIFKYLSISTRMSQLIRTLSEGATEIGYFLFVFAVIFLSFAISGSVAFGVDVEDFRSVGNSVVALFRGLTEGQLQFESLYHSNRVLGPIYYFLFFILAFFVLINIFIAIINRSYERVQASLRSSAQQMSTWSIFRIVVKEKSEKWRNWFRKLRGKAPLHGTGNSASETSADKVIQDEEEITYSADELAEAIVEASSLPPKAAVAFARRIVRQYDTSGTGKLSLAEVENLRDEISDRVKHIGARLKAGDQTAHITRIDAHLNSMMFRVRYVEEVLDMMAAHPALEPIDVPADPDTVYASAVKIQAAYRGYRVRRRQRWM